jgi:hypothetical protein
MAHIAISSVPNPGGTMFKRHLSTLAIVALPLAFFSAVTLTHYGSAVAQGQFPIMNNIADKVVAKYTNSTCEELIIKKANPTPPSMEEQRAIGFLKTDPQMRAAFIAKIAPPIANKMFDCGMIP